MLNNKRTVIILLVFVVIIVIVPIFALKGAVFGGSDDAGIEVVKKIAGKDYQPWFTPVTEKIIGGEIPSGIETLLFCILTGAGVGIIAYAFGYLVARKKYMN